MMTDTQILAVATGLFPDWREDIQEKFVLQLVRGALSEAARTPPVARIHSDGYWTSMPGFREPLNFSKLDVYAGPWGSAEDPLDSPLPCDVKIGGGTHAKGTTLRLLVSRAQRYYDELYGPAPSRKEQAANLARLQGLVTAKFKLGDRVRKTKGSQWRGLVVGTYSTELTPEGYAVESSTEKGSVQIYPASALELNP